MQTLEIQVVNKRSNRSLYHVFCKKMSNDFFREQGRKWASDIFFLLLFFCQPAREMFKYCMVVSHYLVLYHHDLPAEELCVDVAFYQTIRCCYYVSFYGIAWQRKISRIKHSWRVFFCKPCTKCKMIFDEIITLK